MFSFIILENGTVSPNMQLKIRAILLGYLYICNTASVEQFCSN